uniref:glutathione transferase n=1 Tax=Epiphyas postvittana TaxID=65032 RepID=A0A0K8TUF3_EPIPO
MKNVKLYYFPIKARAEGLRMMLVYGGQEFEDIRIPKEEWSQWKTKMKFSLLPVLEIDGQRFEQSVAIARYLGRELGLSGANAKEDFNIDCIIDHCSDMINKIVIVMFEPDPVQKKIKHELFSKEHYPGMLAKLEETIAENDGYLANGKLSWGDFFIAGMYVGFKTMLEMPDFGEKYPNLKALYDRVVALPKVKEWVANAPYSDH